MQCVWRSVIVFIGLAALALALDGVAAADQKEPTIKEIMTKAHKGGDSLIQKVGKDLKADSPDWADVQKKTKELVTLGTSLGKNEPPKGDKASWEKLTKEYVATAKALDDAAQKKDKAKATASHKQLTGMCAKCHPVHRPMN